MNEHYTSKGFMTYSIFYISLLPWSGKVHSLPNSFTVISYFWRVVLLSLSQYCPVQVILLHANIASLIILKNLCYRQDTFTRRGTRAFAELSVGTPILLCCFHSALALKFLQFCNAERWLAQQVNALSASQVQQQCPTNAKSNSMYYMKENKITVLLSVRRTFRPGVVLFLLQFPDFHVSKAGTKTIFPVSAPQRS